MKKLILTSLLIAQAIGMSAQNYKKVEPYLESITKYETFAAKAVDDYSVSIYQDTRKSGVRETLLSKLKEDRHLLTVHMHAVNNDTSYTLGLIDFIDAIIVYFEAGIGDFNVAEDALTNNYVQLEERFKLYNHHADKIEKKFIDLIKLKESFSLKHGLVMKIEYGRDVYKNQFFRYCGKFIEIISKVDFADIKLQQAMATRNTSEMNLHFEKLQDYLLEGKINMEKLGTFKENDRMYQQVNNYIDEFLRFQFHNKSLINLINKHNELVDYVAKNGKTDYYLAQANAYNMNRQPILESEKLVLGDKNNLIVNFTKELNQFQKEHLENLIYNGVKIKNHLFSKETVSMRKN